MVNRREPRRSLALVIGSSGLPGWVTNKETKLTFFAAGRNGTFVNTGAVPAPGEKDFIRGEAGVPQAYYDPAIRVTSQIMSKVFHRTLFLSGPAGRLEAQLWTVPDTAPKMAALLCHPHPLFGGTMHNKVVFQAAKTLQDLGLPVLRFNFRGAGLSQGRHDKGHGEADDVRAALDFLAGECPSIPLLLGGFSFGAWVGLRVGCEDARVSRLMGLGIPADKSDLAYLAGCGKPLLIVQGAQDEFGSREAVESVTRKVPGPHREVFVENAGHFFTGKLSSVDAAIREWMKESGI